MGQPGTMCPPAVGACHVALPAAQNSMTVAPGCLQALYACTQPAACSQRSVHAQRMAEPATVCCLQASYQVTQVQLMNRQDCCRCPLADARIYIGDPSALDLAQTVNPLLSQETDWQLCAEVSTWHVAVSIAQVTVAGHCVPGHGHSQKVDLR